jgi:hypothetical protein
MDEAKMGELWGQWAGETSVPITFDGNPLVALREGGRSFAAFLIDKVELKADDPPKE